MGGGTLWDKILLCGAWQEQSPLLACSFLASSSSHAGFPWERGWRDQDWLHPLFGLLCRNALGGRKHQGAEKDLL